MSFYIDRPEWTVVQEDPVYRYGTDVNDYFASVHKQAANYIPPIDWNWVRKEKTKQTGINYITQGITVSPTYLCHECQLFKEPRMLARNGKAICLYCKSDIGNYVSDRAKNHIFYCKNKPGLCWVDIRCSCSIKSSP